MNVFQWLWDRRAAFAGIMAWLITRDWFTAWAGVVWVDVIGYAALLLGGGAVLIGAGQAVAARMKSSS